MLAPGLPVAVDASVPAIVFLAYSSVAAGFPSPADDYATKASDLNTALIKHPQATFLMRVAGTSMRDAGIDDGDVVLVDRALRPVHGSIIIAVVDGEFTCKRLHKRAGTIRLQAANPAFPDIVPRDGQMVELWGVVTKAIKSSWHDAMTPQPGMYGLVDGNNFYVSCERVFRPTLRGKPVIVLSNNDGCAVSRSNEAKALGVQMGQPWFQCRELEKTAGLIALSSNYCLYGDMSNRMMTIAGEYAPRQEVYSIDESFLDFTGVRDDLVAIGRALRAKVLRHTGIPTCAGFGPTKTLAKLANHVAKTAERKPGSYPTEYARVFSFGALTPGAVQAVFKTTLIDEVWGIGRRIGAKLNAGGIETIADLLLADVHTLRRQFSVVLERTVMELHGVRTIELDDAPAARQQIMCSRSFGHPVYTLADMIEAVSAHATRVAEKARQDASLAGAVHVFAHTSPHRRQDRQYSASTTVPLVRPTADTRLLAEAALMGLRSIYREGYRYEKAGVMLIELEADTIRQGELDLFTPAEEPQHAASRDRTKLMTAMDALNGRYGKGSVQLGSSSVAPASRPWSMKADRRTPRYTTVWEEMPVVNLNEIAFGART